MPYPVMTVIVPFAEIKFNETNGVQGTADHKMLLLFMLLLCIALKIMLHSLRIQKPNSFVSMSIRMKINPQNQQKTYLPPELSF